MQPDPLEIWQGDFGNAYTERNAPTAANIEARVKLWRTIFDAMQPWLGRSMSVLEIGANVGQNLLALRRILPGPVLVGTEPNAKAREGLQSLGFTARPDTAQEINYAPGSFDLVFTSGVLIHIPDAPSEGVNGSPLYQACKEIVRVSKRWVVAIEYFNDKPVTVPYRGNQDLLWKRDFGDYYVREFGLEPIACGFAWKALTGLDNLTWWVLRKP